MHAASLRYVVDASVVTKWFTRHHEPDRDKAIALRSAHVAGRMALVMPEHALLEIANAIRYSGGARETDAVEALDLLAELRLEYAPLGWSLLRSAAAIAWQHRLTVYDAAYVALAEALELPLVTADEVMITRAVSRGSVKRLSAIDLL